ncbi:serine hydrolase domain-containing protein [Nocardiopsis sediminis]|uniref:Serine hydrolase domain-containing protein n=1 Tax=Nocardiopsis sediminis TaxID=1778267 RepID=A0ABV8FG27_9ACTN
MEKKRWAALAGIAVAATATLVAVQATRSSGLDDAGGDTRPVSIAATPTEEPPRITSVERVTLQRSLNEVIEEGSSGAVAELIVTGPGGSDTWNGVAGVADRTTGAPVDPGAHFRIASLSKPFVAATLLQLVGEGRADLDDTLEDLLPGVVDGGEEITLRMLLSHTSGLFSYNRDMPAVVDDPDRIWRPEELVAVANTHGPVFAPGTDVAYSNTNYVVAAMVIEEITGRPYAEAVTERIIEPLELTGTSIPAGSAMPEPVMHAYLALSPYAGAEAQPSDITEFDPSRWYGTAQVVSTVSDINRFWQALLGGEVLEAPMLDEMLSVQATSDDGYGFALGPRSYTLSCGVEVWTHSGNIPGYRNWTVHSEDRHFTLFQARYQANPDPPAWAAIETAMCPAAADAPEEPAPTPTDFPSEDVTDTGRGADG